MSREVESGRKRHQEERQNSRCYGLKVIKLNEFERELWCYYFTTSFIPWSRGVEAACWVWAVTRSYVYVFCDVDDGTEKGGCMNVIG